MCLLPPSSEFEAMKEKKPNVGPINAAVCGPTPTIEPEAFMRPFLAQIREIPFVSI